MMTRRESLKTIALGAGALVALPALRMPGSSALAQTSQPATPPAGAAPAAPAGPFTLPPLGYGFDALEPHIDAQTMELHHDKHHAAYVANLNKAVATKPDLASQSLDDLLKNLNKLPPDVVNAIRNQGGGHYNHSFLWPTLKKDGGKTPTGDFAAAIDKKFNSFKSLQDLMNQAGMLVFGSGWAWLVMADGNLKVEVTSNQDTPLSLGHTPLLGIDVWEHAYYLKYQNRRADYLAAFQNVIDWNVVSQRYASAAKG
jgi:Fe-Mn family superoxide dismutase